MRLWLYDPHCAGTVYCAPRDALGEIKEEHYDMVIIIIYVYYYLLIFFVNGKHATAAHQQENGL